MKSMYRKKNRKKQAAALFLVLLFLIGAGGYFIDSRLLPPLKAISHMQCKTLANDLIDEAVFENLTTLDASALLLKNQDTYTANTMQINTFCAALSADITNGFRNLPEESIKIPIGAATGMNLLANSGPKIPFTLVPMGAVKVDYDTDFSAAGINQINYKIWLMVSMEMKVVNPLYQETLQMERKIMLADLIFGGKVPEHYFQMSAPGEYLLTE